MAMYVYRCDTGHSFESPVYGLVDCTSHRAAVHRDYRAEAVGFNTATLKKERDFGVRAGWDRFLPNAKSFESATDPDGQRGLREWRDSVRPAESNKRPMDPPDLKKQVF